MIINRKIVEDLIFQEYRAILNQRYTEEHLDVVPRVNGIEVEWIDTITSVYEILEIDISNDDVFTDLYGLLNEMVTDKKFVSVEQTKKDITAYFDKIVNYSNS